MLATCVLAVRWLMNKEMHADHNAFGTWRDLSRGALWPVRGVMRTVRHFDIPFWEDAKSRLRRIVLADDGADALAAQGPGQAVRLQAVDDLDALDQPRVVEQIEQGAVEGEGREIASS